MDRLLRLLGKRYKRSDSMSELREKAKSCKLYKMILSSIELHNYPDLSEINIFAEPLPLSIKAEPRETQATCMSRVFADLGM